MIDTTRPHACTHCQARSTDLREGRDPYTREHLIFDVNVLLERADRQAEALARTTREVQTS